MKLTTSAQILSFLALLMSVFTPLASAQLDGAQLAEAVAPPPSVPPPPADKPEAPAADPAIPAAPSAYPDAQTAYGQPQAATIPVAPQPGQGQPLVAPPERNRIPTEILGGALGVLAGSAAAGLVSFLVLIAVLSGSGEGDGVFWAIGASSLLVPLGSSIGVFLGGRVRGGNGSWGASFLGALAGFGVGFGIAALGVAVESPEVVIGGIITGALTTIAGAIIGYELSHSDVQPIVSISPDHGVFGARFAF